MNNFFKFILVLLITPFFLFAQQKVHEIDLEKSYLHWEGSKIIGDSHDGILKFKSGKVFINGSHIAFGNLVVDMLSMENKDIKSKSKAKKLVKHLQSEDFFEVSKHPTANFKLNKTTVSGKNSYKAEGEVEIKGIKQKISFNIEKENSLAYQSSAIKIDREKHYVEGSSILGKIKNYGIKDVFTIKAFIYLKK